MVSGMCGETYSATSGETAILLNPPKPCDLPNPENRLGQMKCPCIFLVGSILI